MDNILKKEQFLIYKWCKKKHPFINSQIIYEQKLKQNKLQSTN